MKVRHNEIECSTHDAQGAGCKHNPFVVETAHQDGSALAFFAKQTNARSLSISLGFSAGVMIYVSLVEIFVKARAELERALEVERQKVAEQQAYVLIFGPLKSGKSTLMNAMAAAYGRLFLSTCEGKVVCLAGMQNAP